jgi:hypothetical protein
VCTHERLESCELAKKRRRLLGKVERLVVEEADDLKAVFRPGRELARDSLGNLSGPDDDRALPRSKVALRDWPAARARVISTIEPSQNVVATRSLGCANPAAFTVSRPSHVASVDRNTMPAKSSAAERATPASSWLYRP